MQTSLKDKLIGSWSLVSFESESLDGSITYPLDSDATGSIIYAVDGYVSINIMQTNRGLAVDKALYKDNELYYADLPYLAYAGSYVVDEIPLSVIHIVAISIYPEWIGSHQFRLVKWLGDELQLSSDGPVGPQKKLFRLHWKRNQAINPNYLQIIKLQL